MRAEAVPTELLQRALAWLTGTWAQWAAYGLGVYAVFSWVQSLRVRDPATHRLIWGNVGGRSDSNP